MNRTTTFITLSLLATVSQAQLNGINSTKLITRYYNDVPNSKLVATNNYPSVEIFDGLDASGGGDGFANRHDWALSNDAGATAYAFNGSQGFSFDFDLHLTESGTPGVEGGIMLDNPGNGNHYFLVKTGNGGEVAAFGGGMPFYSFTASQGVHWTTGSTVHMGMDYRFDGAKGFVTYRYENMTSGELAWGNAEGMMLANTRVGGYVLYQNTPNFADDFGDAQFSNINVVPEPFTIVALVTGLAALARRRRA